jgi:hypothetical protein
VWGTVLEWEPPRLIRMTWHPGHAAENPSEVEVTFARVTETQTLVTIAHDGWERFADPQAARAEYGNGWPMVLADYARSVEPAGDPGDGPVWLVLTHTPAPGVGDPFQHPGFAGHLAFLESLPPSRRSWSCGWNEGQQIGRKGNHNSKIVGIRASLGA